jgi:hypothetical protein
MRRVGSGWEKPAAFAGLRQYQRYRAKLDGPDRPIGDDRGSVPE